MRADLDLRTHEDEDDDTPPPPRRRRSDREPLPPIPVDVQGLPSWLKAAVYLGVPSVIALFLVYVLTTAIAGRVQDIERTQALQQQTIESISKAMTAEQSSDADTRTHFDDGLRRLEQLLRYTCVAAAERDSQKADCLRGRARTE